MKSDDPRSRGAATLVRGLGLARYVAQRGGATLSDASAHLEVSKATALRALAALEASGLLVRRLSDGTYVPEPRLVHSLAGRNAEAIIEGASAPVLRRLAKRVPWPVDVGARRGSQLTVLDSNRRLLRWPYTRLVRGHRPHLLWSAMGRVWLAFCEESDREPMIRSWARSAREGFDDPGVQATLRDIVAEVRARGYARRDHRHPTLDAEAREPQSAIAVPVRARGRLVACINCVWLSDAATEREVVRQHLVALQRAALEIGEAVEPRLL